MWHRRLTAWLKDEIYVTEFHWNEELGFPYYIGLLHNGFTFRFHTWFDGWSFHYHIHRDDEIIKTASYRSTKPYVVVLIHHVIDHIKIAAGTAK